MDTNNFLIEFLDNLHTVNNSVGISCRILNGTLLILSARCVISIESNILQSSCSTPQFFSEEN